MAIGQFTKARSETKLQSHHIMLMCILSGLPGTALSAEITDEVVAPDAADKSAQSDQNQQEVTLADLCGMSVPAKQTDDASAARPDWPSTLEVGQISFRVNPIFDESDPDTFWLHRFANWMHINSKPWALERELPFSTGEMISAADLSEAERLLRHKSYLRDSRIKVLPECNADGSRNVQVETWDTWSLLQPWGLVEAVAATNIHSALKKKTCWGWASEPA